ncbi:MAG: NAD-dependent epimerase/dehydratase family protein [Deltaproteobacteria bacterium]|nr:NAD-dependent epimerase/dehydratase family protein [Deltaproteobacteria bacterium]
MKVCVTGGNGFIGSRVVKELVRENYDVRLVLRKTSKTQRISDLKFEKVYGDILDKESLHKAFQGCDAVIHLACISSWDQIRSGKMEEVAVQGSQNVFEAALHNKIKKLIHVSSAAAVNANSTQNKISNEETKFTLQNSTLIYAKAKHKVEKIALEYLKKGLPIVICNPSEVYGENDDDFVTSGNLRDFIQDWPTLVPHGGTGVVYVGDVAKGIVQALQKGRPGERYILSSENLSIKELAELALEAAGKKRKVITLPNGLLMGLVSTLEKIKVKPPIPKDVLEYAVRYWFVDNAKAKKELGFNPISAKEAIKKTVSWLRDSHYI